MVLQKNLLGFHKHGDFNEGGFNLNINHPNKNIYDSKVLDITLVSNIKQIY